MSRLIDKILQPIGANRPSVFQISNHPWLCDGTDLATVLWQRKNKFADRRTDGSTFPLVSRTDCWSFIWLSFGPFPSDLNHNWHALLEAIFYRPIGSRWVILSISTQPSSRSQDGFPDKQFRLARNWEPTWTWLWPT